MSGPKETHDERVRREFDSFMVREAEHEEMNSKELGSDPYDNSFSHDVDFDQGSWGDE